MTNEERVKYYMGKWYDKKITVRKEDFSKSIDTSPICLVEKATLMDSMVKKRGYKKTLNSYITDGFYLAALGDIRLEPRMIKRQTKSLENDLPIISKGSWAGEKRMGIILKLTHRRHWKTDCHVALAKGGDSLWDKKIDEVIWRGFATTINHQKYSSKPLDEMDDSSSRTNFVRFYYKDYNIGFHRLKSGTHSSWEVLLKESVSCEEQLKYKYIVSLEGNDLASGLKWQLLSNSVVIMPPPTTISWAMEDTLIPYEHYVPLNPAGDNLVDALEWCKQNDATCQKIAKQSTDYMQQFEDEENERLIADSIIKRYNDNVTFI